MSGSDRQAPDGVLTPSGAEFRFGHLGLEDWIGVALLLAIMTAMALGVFFRYVLNDSLSWTEEFARYGLIYITFVGTSTAIRRRTHVRVDVIDLVLAEAARRTLRWIVDLACLGFLAYLAWRTWQIMGFLGSSRSPAMQIPINWVYGGILFGTAMAALRQLVVLVGDVKSLRR
jgi:TRAP-type C4-dicarboxylate transport system permease small subunit